MAGTEVVDTIVRALSEDAEGPRQRIAEIVQAVGESAALELLAQTQRIEDAGGELVKKGSRRRTAGGVFFRLAKATVDLEARRTIFRSPHKPKPKQEQPAKPVASGSPSQKVAQQKNSPQPPVATVVIRPRRRVVELGSIRQPEPPKPPPPQKSPGAWARPAPVRSAVGVAERVKREPERAMAERAPLPAGPIQAKPQAAPASRNVAQQVRDLVAQMEPDEARRLVADLFDEFGPESHSEPKAVVSAAEKAAQARDAAVPGAETRERVLAAVVDALSLEARDLARVLYGDDSTAAIRRAQKTLETQRKSR